MDGLRWGVGRASCRLGREGGSMATGEAGGETPADDETGADALRIWAYEDNLAGWVPLRKGAGGLVCVGVGVGVGEAGV